jgi:hypothetical protein
LEEFDNLSAERDKLASELVYLKRHSKELKGMFFGREHEGFNHINNKQ